MYELLLNGDTNKALTRAFIWMWSFYFETSKGDTGLSIQIVSKSNLVVVDYVI